MAGLVGLVLIFIWFAICAVLAIKIPQWLGAKRRSWLWSLFLFPILVVAPIVDELVGMRQFEQLCKERAVVHVSPDADQVKRAKRGDSRYVELPGYWINITSQPVAYIDIDTEKAFLSYEIFHTKGGRIASIALLGGEHSCNPKDRSETKRLDIDRLLKQGK